MIDVFGSIDPKSGILASVQVRSMFLKPTDPLLSASHDRKTGLEIYIYKKISCE